MVPSCDYSEQSERQIRNRVDYQAEHGYEVAGDVHHRLRIVQEDRDFSLGSSPAVDAFNPPEEQEDGYYIDP